MVAIMQLGPILPEISLLVFIASLLMIAALGRQRLAQHYFIAQVGLVVTALMLSWQLTMTPSLSWHESFLSDPLSQFSKLTMLALCFWIFIYVRDYIDDNKLPSGEFFALCLLSLLGMMLLVSAHNLLVIYLGLELLSLPLYALVALQRDSARAQEAAVKYFVMGALASGMLLYGFSLLYGVGHSLQLSHLAVVLHQPGTEHSLMLLFALVFIVVGLAFKLGAAPFHMWVPDVYEGAPTAVTLWLATAPKVAAFVMIMRLLIFTMPGLLEHWQPLWLSIALLSIILGNVAAIAQTNLKRMLAYSSIAHIGYLSLGILTGTHQGQAAAFFYVISYGLTAVASFGVLVLLSKPGMDLEKITDLRGLNARNPALACFILIMMFSMIGIPPTVGFFAKLGVLQALLEQGMVTVAVLAVLFAVVGAYYYLRVIKVMYFEAPEDELPFKLAGDNYLALSINTMMLLVLGLFPATLMQICLAVF